jgi:hypothetical protein
VLAQKIKDSKLKKKKELMSSSSIADEDNEMEHILLTFLSSSICVQNREINPPFG